MNKLSTCIFGLLAATAILGAGSAKADPILIDDFDLFQDVGLQPITGFIPSSSQEGPDSGIIGGFRDMEVMGDADSFLETRLVAGNGELGFSNNADTNGFGTVVWDGDDDPTVVDTTGLGGIDVTQNNGWQLDRISLDIVSADLPGLELMFTIYDLNGNTSTLARTFGGPILAPQSEHFLFADFQGNADFTQVGAIELGIDGPPELDAAISELRFGKPPVDIPEPLTSLWTLLGISAMGGLYGKRKFG